MSIAADSAPIAARPPQASRQVAVLIPCYNEERSIGKVVMDFRAALPGAAIYVYDNNSTDATRHVAAAAGAVVRTEPMQGKGNVVRRMFADIEAEIYVLADGDDTYHAASAARLVAMLDDEKLDMVTATRQSEAAKAYRPGHRFGNAVLTGAVRLFFGARITDVLSGYRVFSRRFVKSFPAGSTGFETETEFTVHALQLRMPIGEMVTPYGARPEGSHSKLNTVRDGIRILWTIAALVRSERPLQFFAALGGLVLLLGLALGIPVILEFADTGLVRRFPTAILSASLVLLSYIMLTCGLILDSVAQGRREIKRLAYLAVPANPCMPSGSAGPAFPVPVSAGDTAFASRELATRVA